ncbi:hypothetical protein C5C18_11010 [Rathayibacter tritici]|uniref:DUF2238 domain-containing protein n=1 Tax=Rathayibacter tritici TaxID=33888 RepID=A0A160KR31_9MICO|nr:hypothetical protein [Rathayibacter tritici]AND15508.1 hypothetical protein A6122_0348 [Rathayibacter tritici]PPF26233.1 hypothetical protein C5C06_11710 [Rathayibacter tritici]PPF63967.1 hypothetical protein C5C21_12440 [Rathayibacter tritici]PPG06230.1 hypothetical protein C5C18_11010 [Rathayibacter tritici]PPI17260.1 hypothetical protein C5D07_05230 [Rathayibacter tritici]
MSSSALVETFLQLPRTRGEWTADGIRAVGAVSIVTAGVGWDLVDVAVLALAAIGLVLPRFLGIRPALDAAFGVALLVASWSSVLGLYEAWPQWDLVVHCVLNGLIAAVAYIVAARAGVVPAASGERGSLAPAIVLCACFGTTAGVLWEWGEWAGHRFIDSSIFVGYEDTLGDLAAGTLGSVLAGALMRFWSAKSREVRPGSSRDVGAAA